MQRHIRDGNELSIVLELPQAQAMVFQSLDNFLKVIYASALHHSLSQLKCHQGGKLHVEYIPFRIVSIF